jgi:hypothetical protein
MRYPKVGRHGWTLMPADGAGITDLSPILITPDGKSYVHEYGRTLSDLYLVESIK